MPNLAAYAEVRRLLDEFEDIAERLMPNEREMFASLKAKYSELTTPDPFDLTALEVMLRNVEIRKGYDIDPKKDGGRVIDMPRSSDSDQD